MKKTNKQTRIRLQSADLNSDNCYCIRNPTQQAELENKVLTIVNIDLVNQFGNFLYFTVSHNMKYNSHILRPKMSLDYGSDRKINQPKIAVAVVNTCTLRGESQILVKEQHSAKRVNWNTSLAAR